MADFRNDNEDNGPAMFLPDTVLPSQFFGALREKGYVEGEKRLMAAVLSDAVECYMKQAFALEHRGRQLFADAEEWIFDDSPSWFFSFTNICVILGLDPDYVREGLLRWRRSRLRAAGRRLPAAEEETELRKAV